MSRSKRKIFTEHEKTRKRGYLMPLGLVLGGSAVAFVFALLKMNSVPDANAAEITVYKSPTCGCCAKWVDHLEDSGFRVEVKERSNMVPIKAEFGVEPKYQSCHTARIDGYFVEGHVPAREIKRLIDEKPDIRGLSVPGMPMGSPGMEGDRVDRYQVLAIDSRNSASVYSQY